MTTSRMSYFACFVGYSKQISLYATKTSSDKYCVVGLYCSLFDKLLVAYGQHW